MATTTTNKKYQIHNQITGIAEEANSFADIKVTQSRVREEYLANLESIFAITVLVENENGSWTQSICDENGEPVVQPEFVYDETLYPEFTDTQQP
jgi:hypothetical protein